MFRFLSLFENRQVFRPLPLAYEAPVEIFSDFIGGTGEFLPLFNSSGANTFTFANNTGASVVNAEVGRQGILNLITGTTNSGRAAIGTHNTAINFANTNNNVFRSVIRLPVLSDATESFDLRVGFIDSVANDGNNGVFIRYSHSRNSGNWELISRINGVQTLINTSVSVVANDWITVLISTNFTSNTATLNINNTVVTNINISGLNNSARRTGAYVAVQKTAGVNNRVIHVDSLYAGLNLV